MGAFTDASKAAMSIDLGKAKEALSSTLRKKDDLSEADKTVRLNRGNNDYSIGVVINL